MKGKIYFNESNVVTFTLESFKAEDILAIKEPYFCPLGSYITIEYEPEVEDSEDEVSYKYFSPKENGRSSYTVHIKEWCDRGNYCANHLSEKQFNHIVKLIYEDQALAKKNGRDNYFHVTRLKR